MACTCQKASELTGEDDNNFQPDIYTELDQQSFDVTIVAPPYIDTAYNRKITKYRNNTSLINDVIPIVITNDFKINGNSARQISRYSNLHSLLTEYAFQICALDAAKIQKWIAEANVSNTEHSEALLEQFRLARPQKPKARDIEVMITENNTPIDREEPD